jgi:hypothetical protein
MFKVISWRQGRFGLSVVVGGFDFYFHSDDPGVHPLSLSKGSEAFILELDSG